MKKATFYLLAIIICVLGLSAMTQNSCNRNSLEVAVQMPLNSGDENLDNEGGSLSSVPNTIANLEKELHDCSFTEPQVFAVRAFTSRFNPSFKVRNHELFCRYIEVWNRLLRNWQSDFHLKGAYRMDFSGKLPVEYYVFALRQILI